VTAIARAALGRSPLAVGRVGLGCMGMTNAYGPADRGEALATLRHALDLGVDLLDTADVYGGGANEELVGEAIRGRREAACVATKFGILRAGGALAGVNGRPEYARAACEQSLRRLGVEVIDLYTLHRVDPQVPIEETVGAMAGLVAEGKVRHLGLSEAGPETLRRACAAHPIAALQSEYSLWTRDPERGALAACRELGVGFVAYSPLGRGFLTGSVGGKDALAEGDNRRRHPRFQGENLARNLALLDALRGLAAELACTPAQLALRWLLDRGEDVVPIPGTSRRRHLDELLGALALRLAPAQCAALDAAFPPGAAQGDRYPAEVMPTLGR
jgi:aryl-alcohol dehydrogenase-like predicted oxidoreductase